MKKFISALLGIIFVVLIVCAIFVCTYVFSSPSKETKSDSRQIIRGYWTDEENETVFMFDQNGKFTMAHLEDDDPAASLKSESALIAKGYFKIDEDTKKIKVLVMPNGRDKSVDLGEQLYFFTTFTYRNLEYDEENETAVAWRTGNEEEEKASCKFVLSNVDKGGVYTCSRTVTVTDFYDGKDDE
ncbi:MAG: hypothetical protein Q4E74_00900 [Ruminococcus sp.]|nr:hypothetical protein [Ruminococcus sp.]